MSAVVVNAEETSLRMPKRVFDCFIFYNEFELLKIRLAECASCVDFFVICEATVTFQGDIKPLFFKEAEAQFSRFKHQIVHVIVDDLPPKGPHETEADAWKREHHQRNSLRRGLGQARDGDIVIVSDCDEIINPNAIAQLKRESGYFMLDMAMFQFFLNMQAQSSGWCKVFAYSFYLDREIGDFNRHRTDEYGSFQRFAARKIIRKAGWHFTFLGGVEKVLGKLAAYSHTNGWQAGMRDVSSLHDQMKVLREVGGSKLLRLMALDSSFPSTIVENESHYASIGFIKSITERCHDLEEMVQRIDMRRRENFETAQQAVSSLFKLRQKVLAGTVQQSDVENLIPGAHDFGTCWNRGVQKGSSGVEAHVEPPNSGVSVMRHIRNPKSVTADSNVGYFSRIPVLSQEEFVVSCLVYIPNDFAGSSVEISFDGWPEVRQMGADLTVRASWQRICATGRAPTDAVGCNLVLRVESEEGCQLYSTGWRLHVVSMLTSGLRAEELR